MMDGVTIYSEINKIELHTSYPVIWLASWYPSRTSPDNGDFIQRHAEAVALIHPLLVIHTIHDPHLPKTFSYEVQRRGNLTEIILYFRHTGIFNSLLSRIQYNLKFHRFTKNLLRGLFEQNGNPKAIHVHVPMKMGRFALWAKKKWGIPFLLSEQSSKYIGNDDDNYEQRSVVYKSGVKRLFQQALGITNVSLAVAKVLERKFARNDIHVIHNVVDTSLFNYQGKSTTRPFKFLHASNMSPQKNFKGILDAFTALYRTRQDFELTILGGKVEEEQRWNSYRAPWLKWIGPVKHSAVAEYMQQADAFVLFSWSENFPCVIVEALCSGLVVVSSDTGGCAEAIDPTNGIVVKTGDEIALYNALNNLIDHYEDYYREQISKSAALRYSYKKIGNDFWEFYRQLGVISP